MTNRVKVPFRGDLTHQIGIKLILVIRGKNRPGLR